MQAKEAARTPIGFQQQQHLDNDSVVGLDAGHNHIWHSSAYITLHILRVTLNAMQAQETVEAAGRFQHWQQNKEPFRPAVKLGRTGPAAPATPAQPSASEIAAAEEAARKEAEREEEREEEELSEAVT